MITTCRVCASPVQQARFCPACGTEVPPTEPTPADPLIGQKLLGRYEVVELISAGGMGLVYRALHHPLDRNVAVKLVHPRLTADKDIVARFMVEAQIASRLNHPNIVSIHDFGWTPPSEGGHLILVMELLGGSSLTQLLKTSSPLPLPRVADIVVQILGALGEAHFHGVVHRDVKPANIVVQPERDGTDRVKLIDFGIARLDAGQRITREGQILGTTSYMAPEQTRGRAAPSADLYAVGVIFFQMLAGRVPFTGPSPEVVMAQHTRAPRPDPRLVAPDRGIPDALAEVCLKAMAVEPRERYLTADAFAHAVLEAAELPAQTRTSRSFMSLDRVSPIPIERRSSRPPPDQPTRIERRTLPPAPSEEPTVAEIPFDAALGAPLPPETELFGRNEELAWATAMVSGQCPTSGFVLWGRAGVGRTSLLRAVLSTAVRSGATALFIPAPPAPSNELSGEGLRAVLTRLTGVGPWNRELVTGSAASEPLAALGLRVLFGGDSAREALHPETVRSALVAALLWGIRGVRAALRRGSVILAIDDADLFDNVSRAALASVLCLDPIADLVIVASSESSPEQWAKPPLFGRELRPLPRGAATNRLDERGRRLVPSSRTELEPLYVEQLHHWLAEVGDVLPPEGLLDLVEARLHGLSSSARWALQAVTVAGEATLEQLVTMVPEPDSFYAALLVLELGGFVEVRRDAVGLRHAIFGRVAQAIAPRGAMAFLHARLLDSSRELPVELLAHHRAAGEAALQAFLSIEHAARLRFSYGDDDGGIAMLSEGLRLARGAYLNGDEAAESAWAIFVEQLASALVRLGRSDGAAGAFVEILEVLRPSDPLRARMLAGLARTTLARGRPADAEARFLEAIAVAERLGDWDFAGSLRAELSAIDTAEPAPNSARKRPARR
jgi:serine/threonine protein kinase